MMKFISKIKLAYKVIARDTSKIKVDIKNLEKGLDKLLEHEKKEFKSSESHMSLEKRLKLFEHKHAALLKQKNKIETEIQENPELSESEKKKDLTRLEAQVRHFEHGIKGVKDALIFRDKKELKPGDLDISSRGAKLEADKIKCFALPAGHTCPKKGACGGHCFALSGRTENQESCRDLYMKSLGISERKDFVEQMNKELSKIKPTSPPWKDPFRIHSWGDFYSNNYAEKWLQIVKSNPQIWFYAYTKSHQMPAVKQMEKLPNIKILQSFDGKDDAKIDPAKPMCFVFDSKEEMNDWNTGKIKVKRLSAVGVSPKDGKFVECRNSDLVAADPKNKRVGIIMHGKTHKPKGFDIESLGAAQEDDRHLSPHLYDQIDAPHNWNADDIAEHEAYVKNQKIF